MRSLLSLRRELFIVLFLFVLSCNEDGLEKPHYTIKFNEYLSSYNIYQGLSANLEPSDDFQLYELATELYSDYAEKQRLIKVPNGSVVVSKGSLLPDFPDGTFLVKTFFYHHDQRDHSLGKRVIETRLEIKAEGKWNVATYLWNDEQTDARLITTGINTNMNWIDGHGKPRVIAYHVPSSRECATCHHSSKDITPIGPKLRNMNTNVVRNGIEVNQLDHLQSSGVLETFDHASFEALPDWTDESVELDKRARAYFEVNCAHCHQPNGVAGDVNLDLRYETDLKSSNIDGRKLAIENRMKDGRMPRLGVTLVHEEGLDLVRQYLETL